MGHVQKPVTVRTAVAVARVLLFGPPDGAPSGGRATPGGAALSSHRNPNLVAHLAGIRAAKMTSSFIPLCHGLNLSKVCQGKSVNPAVHVLHLTQADSPGTAHISFHS